MGAGVHGRTAVDVVLGQWPTLIFVPAVVVLLAVLVAITGWWDRRDAARLAGKPAASPLRRARASRWKGIGAQGLRPWRLRTRCNCSWHSVAAGARTRSSVG